MLTEKKQYNLLKKIFKNENIDFSEIYKDYDNMNPEQRRTSLEIPHLLKELIDKNYVKSVTVDFSINGFPHKYGHPLVTTEGSNFMEHYRKKGSILAKINNIYTFFCKTIVPLWAAIQIYNYFFPKN